MNRWLITALVSFSLISSSCMGSFETARVVPLKAGITYFTTVESSEEDSFNMLGIIVETGFPAGPSKVGVGFHLRASLLGADDSDDGAIFVWGSKLQLPENSLADMAVSIDFWGYYPSEIKLIFSKKLSILEPYCSLGIVGFLESFNNDDDFLSTDGLLSYTLGTMVDFAKGSGWLICAEVEAGDVWASPGIGFGLIKEF